MPVLSSPQPMSVPMVASVASTNQLRDAGIVDGVVTSNFNPCTMSVSSAGVHRSSAVGRPATSGPGLQEVIPEPPATRQLELIVNVGGAITVITVGRALPSTRSNETSTSAAGGLLDATALRPISPTIGKLSSATNVWATGSAPPSVT